MGIGTLYRHFPTRDALVEEAYRSEVAHLCEAADELGCATLPPDEALAAFMDRFVDYAATKKGIKTDAHGGRRVRLGRVRRHARRRSPPRSPRSSTPAIAAGTIRSDVDAEDVLRAMGAVWSLPAGAEDQARRVLGIVMDGLRHGAGG